MGDKNGFFLIIIVIIVVVAFFTVDPDKLVLVPREDNTTTQTTDSEQDTPATKDDIAAQLDEAERRAEELQEEIKQAQINESRSPYYGLVTIDYISNSSKGDADAEYMRLGTSYYIDTPINISGWKIKSRYTNTEATIPTGSRVYLPNGNSASGNIQVSKYQSVYLLSGRSPLSESFQVNKCSGYLEEFYDFYPSLSRSCPDPLYDTNISPTLQNEACLDYIDDMPRCQTQTEPIPYDFPSYCTEYINQKINYPSCVGFHKNDDDFFKSEWRVYLERGSTLWRSRNETIDLLDKNGKIVDTYTN